MSDVLWTDGMGLDLTDAVDYGKLSRYACELHTVKGYENDDGAVEYPLTPDECDSLAAALTQAANKKRSEGRVRQMEQEGRASK